jgi:hypothetical protein
MENPVTINGNDNSKFSAAHSMMGYLYQSSLALLLALRRLRKKNKFVLSIETLDDVVFENEFEPIEILQTKHHLANSANLTDASVDLWKSIRIWAETFLSMNSEDAQYYLITTSSASSNTAASYLKNDETCRDIKIAIERLNSIANSSSNKENQEAYSIYKKLNDEQKNNLFESVYIIDSSPIISDLSAKIEDEIFHAVEQRFLDSFQKRLEGWWYKRIVKHLSCENRSPILSEELQYEMTELREQFKQENLPIDDDIFEATVDASGYQDHIFVHQLKLTNISDKRIVFAIQDYFRAYEQRSRWVREDLLLVGDLERYEKKLTEEWERRFERMKDEVGEAETEIRKKEFAKKLYEWVETENLIPIRPRCLEGFIARGSYHILSDQLKVGWHPNFIDRLKHLLEPVEAARE